MGSVPAKQEPKTELDLYEAAATMSMTSRGSDTPTHTAVTEPDELPGLPGYSRCSSGGGGSETVPWPGSTFIIREPTQGLAITLTEGNLRLRQDLGTQGGCHWTCVDKNGWLGFRNTVSGTYIGHDERRNFYAKVQHHKEHEYFCVRRHPEGGYLLLMRHGSDLWKMDIGKDGESLVETKGEGTAWEFVRV